MSAPSLWCQWVYEGIINDKLELVEVIVSPKCGAKFIPQLMATKMFDTI